MEVKVTGHEFQYDITGLSLLFFPGEPVAFRKRCSGEHRLSSRLMGEDGTLIAKASFFDGKKRFTCRKRVLDPMDRESMLAAVKFSVFCVFRRSTKISPPWGILTGIKPTGVYRRILEAKGPAETRRFLMREYCLQPHKIPLLHQVCKVMETVQTDCSKEASLYVSIPFCPSRCTYCSFISVAAEKSNRLIRPYLDRLIEEINEKADVLKRNHLKIKSVYVGGGTPGILDCEQMEILLRAIAKITDEDVEEFTYELGRPDTVDERKLILLKKYGVNRICINTQTTNDNVLEAIGRRHNREQYLAAVSLTRKLKFDSINTDLIAGLPGEDEASFDRSLRDVIAAGVDNITIHTLSIKRSSRLYSAGNYFDPVNDHVQAMLDRAYDELRNAGYVPYYMYRQKNTVSNGENIGFARPDTIGRYNLYMMEDLHTVAACGAGASSKIISKNGRIERVINMKYPYEYINENERIHENTNQFERKLKENI